MLEKVGCNVLNVPTIKITDIDHSASLETFLKNISAFEWLIFTSANAVRYFFKLKSRDHEDLHKIKMACVGKKTGEVLNSFGFEPHLIPNIFSNQGLLDEIKSFSIRGKHILLPVSNVANDELQIGLSALGAHVKRLEIYENVPYKDAEWEAIHQKIIDNEIDCLVFYSPSAMNAFVQLMQKEGIQIIKRNNIPIAVIGASTAQTAREHDLHPEIMPSVSDDEHLVQALKSYFGDE
jgi:uroporphyrinogen-III synthase